MKLTTQGSQSQQRSKSRCPLGSGESAAACPLSPAHSGKSKHPAAVIIRSERRSWFTLALTGFGAVLLRYLKTVRERVFEQTSPSPTQPRRQSANPKQK